MVRNEGDENPPPDALRLLPPNGAAISLTYKEPVFRRYAHEAGGNRAEVCADEYCLRF
jgi:hypothetical protein